MQRKQTFFADSLDNCNTGDHSAACDVVTPAQERSTQMRSPIKTTYAVPPSPSFAEKQYQNFIDTIKGHEDPFIHTGLFSVSETKLTKPNCRKVSSILLDCDIKHVLKTKPVFVAQCEQQYRDHYASDEAALSRLDDPGFNVVEKVVMELWSAEEVARMAQPILEPAISQLQRWLGKPNKIMCSGNGVHIHYWLEDKEGWDAAAALTLEEHGVRANRDEYIALAKAIVAHMNAQAGCELFDPTVAASLGSRKCREVNTLNTKSANNVKRTFFMGQELCDETARFNLDSCSFYAEEGAARATKSTAAEFAEKVATSAGGKNFVKADTMMLVEDGKGGVQECSVEEVLTKLRSLPTLDNGKSATLRCRMHTSGVPLSHENSPSLSDLNGVCQINAEGKFSAYFSISASKGYAQPPIFGVKNGQAIAFFIYDGASFSLMRNPKTGAMLHTVDNYAQILRFDPLLCNYIRYNVRKDTIYANGRLNNASSISTVFNQDEWRPMIDSDVYSMNHYMESTYSPTSPIKDELLNKAIELVAMSRGYDPVEDYVTALVWDGVDRFGDAGGEGWINTILENPKSAETYDLYNKYSAVIANSVVHNIFCLRAPSEGQHLALFAGPQGCGKSLCSRVFGLTEELTPGVLCKEYFKEDGVSMKHKDNKDTIMSLFGCFIIECPESVSSSNDTTAQEIKAFLTTDTFQYRKPYAKKVSTGYKSTFIFTNSNDEVFLTDDTGNRRFLIIDCFRDLHHTLPTGQLALNIAWLRANIAQIYAQAYQRVHLGQHIPAGVDRKMYKGRAVQDWNLSFTYRAAQEKHNELFMCATNLTVAVEKATETLVRDMSKSRVTLEEVRAIVKQQSPNIGDAQLRNRLSAALKQNGWVSRHTKDGNRWVYEAGTITPPAASADSFTFGYTQPLSDSAPRRKSGL